MRLAVRKGRQIPNQIAHRARANVVSGDTDWPKSRSKQHEPPPLLGNPVVGAPDHSSIVIVLEALKRV